MKINVWEGIINDTIIDPYFIGKILLQFLRAEVIRVVANMLPNTNNPNLPDDLPMMVHPSHKARNVFKLVFNWEEDW